MNIWITPPVLERIKPYLDRLQTMDTSLPLWVYPLPLRTTSIWPAHQQRLAVPNMHMFQTGMLQL